MNRSTLTQQQQHPMDFNPFQQVPIQQSMPMQQPMQQPIQQPLQVQPRQGQFVMGQPTSVTSEEVQENVTTTTTRFYMHPHPNQLQQFFGNMPMIQTQPQQQPGQPPQQAFVQYSVPTNINQQFMQQQQPGQQQQQQYFVKQGQPRMQEYFYPQMMPQQQQQQPPPPPPQQQQQPQQQVYTSQPCYRQMPQQVQQPSQQTHQPLLKQLQAQHKIKSEQPESLRVAGKLLSLSDDSGSCSDLNNSSDTENETAKSKQANTNTTTLHNVNSTFSAVVVNKKPKMGRPVKGSEKATKSQPKSEAVSLRRGRGPGKNNKGRKPRPKDLEMHAKYCCIAPHCDKTFISPSKLRRHMLVHNGIKQFGCKLCHNRFGQKSALIVHLKRKHPQMLDNPLLNNDKMTPATMNYHRYSANPRVYQYFDYTP